MTSQRHGTSRGPLLVALGGIQAPRCGWEPGGCIQLLFEVRQDTGKALSVPAGSGTSFLLQELWLPVLRSSPMPWSKLGGGNAARILVKRSPLYLEMPELHHSHEPPDSE